MPPAASSFTLPGLVQTQIGKVAVWHLGPLDAARVLVIAGRANQRKASALLNTMAIGLHEQHGFSLVWFASPRSETMYELDLAFDAWFGNLSVYWREHGAAAPRILRKLLYCGLLLARPARWSFFPALLSLTNAGTARDLRRFLGALPAGEVHLLGHSAGAIAATLAADAPRVSRVICLGYPFRHPDRAEEPGRTAHLAKLAKPVLILQGKNDVYGTATAAGRYALSPSVRVVPIDADHDYDLLPPAEIQRCAELLAGFAGANGLRPLPDQTGQASPAAAAAAILRSRP